MNDRMIGDRNDLGSPDAIKIAKQYASELKPIWKWEIFSTRKNESTYLHYSVELDIVRALSLKPGNLLEYMEEKISSQEDRVERFSSVRV